MGSASNQTWVPRIMPYSCQTVGDGRCIVDAFNLYAFLANKNHALNSIVGAAFGGKFTNQLSAGVIYS